MLEITTLTNGLRVASLFMPGLESASVGLYIDAGSRFEEAATNGLAHMLEHMVFKGTQKRSARAIAEEIEAVGGHINAYTTRDYTAFYVRLLAQDLALGVDLLADLVLRARFEPQEIHKEREVILQELGQALDTPDDIVFDHLNAASFPDQAVGRSILGSTESLALLGASHLRAYLAQNYKAGSMVLAAAGKVEHKSLVAYAQRYGLGDLPAGKRQDPERARYVGTRIFDTRDLEQTHIALGMPSVSYTDPDYYNAQLFSTLVGGGMSSRLFQELREERGLVYSVFTSLSPLHELGLFSLYLGTGPELARQVYDLSLAIVHDAASQVLPDELDRAKAQAKAGLLMSLESPSALAEQIGRHLLLFDRVIPVQELIEHVAACDVASVARTAQNMLAHSNYALAVVGPAGGLEQN
jgi:predicted Zn-dependent peptidase